MERVELTEQDVEEVLANLAAAKDPVDPSLRHGRRLEERDLPAIASGAGSARLAGVSDVVRVGALRTGASLPFATDGLTVIYGDNGAGKSTFARLLKQACRARVQDDNVHPNVFAEDALGPQTYTLSVIHAGVEEAFPRRVGDAPEPKLGSVSVFDAACADHYVAKDDEPAYVPRAIQLLERLARAQNALREVVAARKRELERARPDFSSLPPLTTAASAMAREDLDAATVERLTRLEAGELARLTHLESLLESTARNGERLDALEQKVRTLEQLRERVVRLSASASAEAVERWRALRSQADELAATLTALGAGLEDAPLRRLGTRKWVALWRAAHAFFAECETTEVWGERCPLCQQELDGRARDRFERFQALATNEVEREHEAARREADAVRGALEVAKVEGAALARVGTGAEAWCRGVRAYGATVEAFLAAVLEGPTAALPGPPPVAELDRAVAACAEERAELVALRDAEKLASVRAERDELLARRQLLERREEALRLVAQLRQIRELDSLHSALATNKLSREQKKLADQLVTQRLCEELDRARRDLGVRSLRVELDPVARKGRALVKLVLPRKKKAKLEEVFSLGERRCLALAFFLAEVAAAEHDGTIVLDDPVSSLDADRRLSVARRLVEESRRRQVIVFTHDPHFLILLRRESRGAMKVLTCTNVNGTAGHVSDEEPWTTSPAASLVKRIRRQHVKDARKHGHEQNAEAYQRTVMAALKLLRKAWERAVGELMCGVIEPGSFEVHTQKLHELVVTEEMVGAVTRAMSALSFDAHDQGPYMAQPLPRVDELEGFVEELEAFLALVESSGKRSRLAGAGAEEGRSFARN